MALGPDHIVLITNLRQVVINDVHLDAHALLIEPPSDDVNARVRGFMSCGVSPVFDVRTRVFEHTIDAGGREEFVRFGGGLVVQLFRHAPSAPLDVQRFAIDKGGVVYLSIWEILKEKVARYWPRHLWMPRTVFGPV